MNFYRKILKIVKTFFVKYGQKTLVKKLGIFLYKISSFIALKYLVFKLPKIKTVYSMTEVTGDWFRVGVSDIDLIVVFSDIDNLEIFDYYKKIYSTVKKMELIFPFVWLGGSPFFEKDFKLWYSLNMEYFHNIGKYKDLCLLYGPDLRPKMAPQNKIGLSAFSIRLFFEEIFVEIYYNILNKENRFRNTYKFFKLLSQISYSIEKNKVISFHSEVMEKWLSKAGCEPQFVKQLLQMPALDYLVIDEDFSVNLIYNTNIIINYIGQQSKTKPTTNPEKLIVENFPPKIKEENIESIKNFIEKISKKNIYSIFITKSIFVPQANSYTLYLTINNKNKEETKKQIKNILASLKLLQVGLKNISIKVRSKIYLDSIFPLILFSDLLNFNQFMNGGCLNESPNIKYNSLILSGVNPNLTPDFNDSAKGIYDIIHVSFNLMDDLTFDIVFIYFLQYLLLIKTKKLYLDNIINIYNKVFKESIDLKNREASYLKYRELIKNFYEINKIKNTNKI
ncbi:MAG: hypothetical protein WCX70_00675 [Candidatus Paceibacterota bacterium]|jgi:hypothetical protein